jgi:hypothetical protein
MNVKSKILLFLLLPLWACAHQGDVEFKRTVAKEFTVNNNAKMEVRNKYGKIIVHTWPKNQIKATVIITGYGKNTSEAQDIANSVDIQTDANAGAVSLQTSYNPGKGGKWFPWGDKKDSKDYVNIDYELYVPQSLDMLALENNFGDVITDELPFNTKMRLNYCFYAIREAAKSLEMDMNYCSKGRIDKAADLQIRANYSDIRCDAADKLETKSNYSDYALGSLGSLVVKANYSDYKIRQVGTVDAVSNYSDFNISNLKESVNLRQVYGDVKVKYVDSGFKGGDMQLTYSDAEFIFAPRVALRLSVNLNYGDLGTGNLPVKNVTSVKKNTSLSYSATTASGNEQSPMFTVNGSQSDVNFKEQ